MSEGITTTRGGLLDLHAQTALHPGSGTALGTVDLPVQRERHTHWPNIAGSALKGILRDTCREQIAQRTDLDTLNRFDDNSEKDTEEDRRKRRAGRHPRERADATMLLNEVFGPPAGNSSEFAGALSVTDGRLLAFPVRSLKGVFAWTTCPAVLDRLVRDAALVGQTIPWKPIAIADDHAVVSSAGCDCLVGDATLVLEEFEFTKAKGDAKTAPDAKEIAIWIATNLLPGLPPEPTKSEPAKPKTNDPFLGTRTRFPRHFVILSDNDFTHFARHATEVMARVGLDYNTKTVKEGALFYQEFLPAETLLYAVVLANAARGRSGGDAATMLETLRMYLPPVLQIGGDETTGKGYCAKRWLPTPGGKP